MPGLDRSGPLGEGPMTGRKQGRCNPNRKNRVPEETQNPLTGRGLGLGKGKMRGRNKGLGKGQARGKNRRFGR
jgi:hypothetical protein